MKQYTCEKCKFTTNHRSSLYRHNHSRKHLQGADVKTISKPRKMFNCESCGYSTAIKSNYTRHCKSKRHQNKKLNTIKEIVPDVHHYDCLACNLKFKSRMQCVYHLRNAEHQKNVRTKYPETLYNPESMCLRGINVKLCATYFRYKGVPINVKIPTKKVKRRPVREVIEEPKVEVVVEEKPMDTFEFEPINDEEMDSIDMYSRCEFSQHAYEDDVDKLRIVLIKAIKVAKHLEIDLDGEGLRLNYESIETINDFITGIQKIVLDDEYMSDMYGKTW